MNCPLYKIVVLGQGRVGKTSMSLKYVRNEFSDDQESTTNASYLQKKQKVNGDVSVRLAIWVLMPYIRQDTAGQQKYNAIAPVYYRDALGAIVTYEIVSQQSFDRVKKWVKELEDNSQSKIIINIAGNKADLENYRIVNNKQAEIFAKEHNANHFLVSAKSGVGIEEVFKNLATRIYESRQKSDPKSKNARRNPRLQIENESLVQTQGEKKKRKCCEN